MSNDENTYYDTGETISSESLQIEEIGFNCPLCSSLIEILSIKNLLNIKKNKFIYENYLLTQTLIYLI